MNVVVMGLHPSTLGKTTDTLVRAISDACAANQGPEGLQRFDPNNLAVSFPICLRGNDKRSWTILVTVTPSSAREVYLRTNMDRLAEHIGKAVKKHMGQSGHVRCLATKPSHTTNGSWSSDQPELHLVEASTE